jgi:xylulokinase
MTVRLKPDTTSGPLYLGLDSSTQSLTAVVIEVDGDRRRVVLETSLVFDEALPHYGTAHGVLKTADPAEAVSPPLMWAEALDLMMARLAESGLDMGRLAAVSGSAQQHGSVYLNHGAAGRLARLDAAIPLVDQVAPMLSRRVSPIWMDASTRAQCAAITAAAGGPGELARHTGSRAVERFTGPQIRKFFESDAEGYAATGRVHLVSSFLASLLCGRQAPIDPGDGSGMNLMDLASREWWPRALEATAPALADKLPPIAASWSIAGHLGTYWQQRYGLPPARVIVWSGDNPCSLVGVGLVREGRLAVSLGTSDTVFGLMREPRVDVSGTGHVFGAPTGDFMGLTCFSNGSLARERVRDTYGLTWDGFSKALDETPPGNGGRLMLPWFEAEITPSVARPAVHRHGLDPSDGPGNVRAVVEGQMMALARHSRWMGVPVETIYATGGAAANRQLLQVMADVFGAEVLRFDTTNSAALGAALRAFHGSALAEGRQLDWDDVVMGIAEPDRASRIAPAAGRPALYRDLMAAHAAFEAECLAAGR